MALRSDYADQDCAIARALEVVGERWTILILRDLMIGVRRFSDLQAHLDISKAVLADRLDRLVGAGIVEKQCAGGHPEYALTDAGVAFQPVLVALGTWGERHANPDDRPTRTLQHVCGAALDGAGRCPRCDVVPPAADIVTVPDPERPSRRTDPVAQALRGPHRLLTPVRG